MKQTPPNASAEQHVREIRRKTRKQHSSEQKIRIVISGLRGEHLIAELCRREGVAESLYYVWSKEFPELSPRELAVTFTDVKAQFISETSAYRLLRANGLLTSPAYIVMEAADEFKDKTTAPNQLWQTDFTYLKVIGWGWFYLSTILDDFSRFIVGWKLRTTMKAADVTATVGMALAGSRLDGSRHRPRLLSDNGSSYVAGDLATRLGKQNIKHVRGAPNHPMTQGKIERWHQTMKNRILLENYFVPGDLEAKIGSFVGRYNHCRYHESIGNLTPADVYTGRGQAILERREAIKRKTAEHRRLLHRQATA